jgi:hypothetical protein
MELPMRGLLFALSLVVLVFGSPTAWALQLADVEAAVDQILTDARAAGAALARRGAITFVAPGDVTVANVEITTPGDNGLTLRVDTLRMAGFSHANERWQASALSAEGFSVTGRLGSARIPRVSLDTVSAPVVARADGPFSVLRALLTRSTMAQFNISPGDFRFEADGARLEGTLPAFSGSSLRDGVLQRLTHTPFAMSGTARTGETGRLSIGQGLIEGYNFPVLFDLLTPPENPDTTLVRQLYDSSSVESFEVLVGEGTPNSGRIVAGRFLIEDVQARTPRIGYLEYMQRYLSFQRRMSERADTALRSPEAIALNEAVLENAGSVLISRISYSGGRAEASNASMTLPRIEARRLSATGIGSFKMMGMSVTAPGNVSMRLDRLLVRDLDFSALLKAAVQDPTQGNPARQYRGAFPRLGALEVTNLNVTGAPQAAFSLQGLAFGLGRWIGYVPESLNFSVSDFVMPLAVLEAQMQRPRPSELGYRSLPISTQLQTRFSAPDARLNVQPARISIAGMGAITLEADLGRIGPEIYELHRPEALERSMMSVTAERIWLRLENTGLFERFLEWRQQTARVPASQQRTEMIAIVRSVLVGTIANAELRRTIDRSVEQFVNQPQSLTLELRPRRPMRFADAIQQLSSANPLDGIDVTISAND